MDQGLDAAHIKYKSLYNTIIHEPTLMFMVSSQALIRCYINAMKEGKSIVFSQT